MSRPTLTHTLALALLIATTAPATPAAPAAPALPTKTFEKTVPLAGAGTLVVDTYKGSVTLNGWDRPEVRVTARIEGDAECASPAADVEKTSIEVTVHGSEVRVRTDYDALPKWSGLFSSGCSSRPAVHYDISAPAAASFTLKDYKSASVLSGVRGNLDLTTYKGTVRVTGAAGSLRVDTYKGDVSVAMAGLPRGASVETYKGRVEVSVPKGTPLSLDGETHRGSIDVAGLGSPAAVTTRDRRHGGSVAGPVNGGGPSIRLSTYKGTIRLRES